MIRSTVRLPSISNITKFTDPEYPSQDRYGSYSQQQQHHHQQQSSGPPLKRARLSPGAESPSGVAEAKQILEQAIELLQNSPSESPIGIVKTACNMLEECARSMESPNMKQRSASETYALDNRVPSLSHSHIDEVPRGSPHVSYFAPVPPPPHHMQSQPQPQPRPMHPAYTYPMLVGGPAYQPYPVEMRPGYIEQPKAPHYPIPAYRYQATPQQNHQKPQPQPLPTQTQSNSLSQDSPKCQKCGITETPEWRGGPNGSRTLCNACGLFHAKLTKKIGEKAAAAEFFAGELARSRRRRTSRLQDRKSENPKH